MGGADAASLPAALAWFSRPAAAEEPGAGGAARDAEEDEAEAQIIQLLKRAKVRALPRRARPRGRRRNGGSEVKRPELDGAGRRGRWSPARLWVSKAFPSRRLGRRCRCQGHRASFSGTE